MNATSGSGSSGTFVWGLVAGFFALIVAGGVYFSGIFGGVQDDTAPGGVVVTGAEPGAGEKGAEEVAVVEPPQKAQEQPAAQTDASQPEPEATLNSDEAASVQPDPEADGAEDPDATAPELDQIFVEPDGTALLSGNAAPGVEIHVLLNGESVHSFFVDASGQFAEFVTLPFADDARGLVLESRNGDQSVQSDDYVIAALPAPVLGDTSTEVAQAPSDTTSQPDIGTIGTDESTVPETDTSTTTVSQSQAVDEDVPSEPAADSVANNLQVADDAEIGEEPETPAGAEPEKTDQPGQQVAILRSGEEGVELVQPPVAQDSKPDQVALDTIGYSDTGNVELTGRVPDGSAVRLYLDNELVLDSLPTEDGQWRGEIEGVDPGVYTLRVDEVSPSGSVVSRLETPFKREPVEALRAAEASEAENPATGGATIRSVTVQKGDTLWAISRDRFGDGVLYVKLFEANRDAIRDPDLIYPGQIFTIPE